MSQNSHTPEQLATILADHKKWEAGEGGNRANLNRANLNRANLNGANLNDANLNGANLIDANLNDANLIDANLNDAVLTRANLAGALGLPAVDPMPDIKSIALARIQSDGCGINMKTWHECETVHCLGGWFCTIHPQGKLLESIYGTGTAASFISWFSTGEVPDFYDFADGGNERAIEWLKKPNANALAN